MITRYFIFVILILGCCKDEPVKSIDECPTCISSIKVNGTNWPSKPIYASFKIVESIDTFFILEIDEIQPTSDSYSDALFFNRIPYELGEYRLDTNLFLQWGTDINFHIYEVEYGTAIQIYEPVLDGSNIINVVNINKSTGEFNIDFNLKLFPNRNPNGEVHNSTYPLMIQFEGQAQGIIIYE